MLTRKADFASSTANSNDLTCELVWSTGADVERRDKIGAYGERLRMDPEAVDLSRLHGAPLLNAHCQRDLGDVLGVVTEASVNGRQGTATVRFSERAKAIFDDVAAGILRQVSVGYHVAEWSTATEAGKRIRIATRWQPLEISSCSSRRRCRRSSEGQDNGRDHDRSPDAGRDRRRDQAPVRLGRR